MRSKIKRFTWIAFALLAMFNVVAIFHSWHFSHFTAAQTSVKKRIEDYSWPEKIGILITGAPAYRQSISRYPTLPYEEFIIEGDKNLSAWIIEASQPKGTFALFHGYNSNKEALITRAEYLNSLGYNAVLLDFEASGDSEGEVCSVGFHEADQVARTVKWIEDEYGGKIYLFGNSMGAAAAMKYRSDNLDSNSPSIPLILECPFSSLHETTQARFQSMGLPSFPFAELLVFWGGAINGFNGFEHNPVDYASDIQDQILFLHGAQDDRVTRSHMTEIIEAHEGETSFKSFPNAGHEDYFIQYENEWKAAVSAWLEEQSHSK